VIDRFERFSVAIFSITRYWHKLAAEELAKYGLKGAHATYLTVMYKYPHGITVPQLCELCGEDKSDASRMISILEQKGLVTKQLVGGSLYRGKLVLTEEGRLAAEQVSQRASLAVEEAGKDLTDEAREIFYQSLESVTANMRELCKEGLPKL
jgi:DNA-binding MarR family transcriptional regulator